MITWMRKAARPGAVLLLAGLLAGAAAPALAEGAGGVAAGDGGIGIQQTVVCNLTQQSIVRPDYPGGSLSGASLPAGAGFRVLAEVTVNFHQNSDWSTPPSRWAYGHGNGGTPKGWVLSDRLASCEVQP